MKICIKLIIIVLSLYWVDLYAASITCFSAGVPIYDGKGNNFFYTDNGVMFTDENTHKRISIVGNCLISYEKGEKIWIN